MSGHGKIELAARLPQVSFFSYEFIEVIIVMVWIGIDIEDFLFVGTTGSIML